MISVLCANPSSAESSHDQFISIQLFIRSFLPSFLPSFIHSFMHAFIHSFIHSSIHSSPLPFIHLLIPSFPYFMHLLVTRLSISVCKCDHPGMLSEEKQKTKKVIVVFFLESLTWQRIHTLLISEEWFCIRLLQVTRYTDPGDIWRKLKLRGEDTGSAASSTSSDGKPEEESRLNVSISSFFSFFCTSLLRLVKHIWSYLSVSLRQNRNELLFISNGNRTEWSTIQGVIGQVISRTRTIWNESIFLSRVEGEGTMSRVEGNICFSHFFFFGKGNNRCNQCH